MQRIYSEIFLTFYLLFLLFSPTDCPRIFQHPSTRVFSMSVHELENKVLRTYRDLDRQIRDFRLHSGLRCKKHCGACCESSHVEATTLECLPLAREIFRRGQEDDICTIIDKRLDEGTYRCVLYLPDSQNAGLGKCSFYPFRPLICRLFGYAARKNKYGKLELSFCKVMQDNHSAKQKLLSAAPLEHLNPPVFQSSFLRIASLNPAMGFHLQPINRALKEAMEYVYWHRPETWSGYRKVA